MTDGIRWPSHAGWPMTHSTCASARWGPGVPVERVAAPRSWLCRGARVCTARTPRQSARVLGHEAEQAVVERGSIPGEPVQRVAHSPCAKRLACAGGHGLGMDWAECTPVLYASSCGA